MLLFTGEKNKIIIPLDRVYSIITVDCKIVINYDGGDLINVEGQITKKIETIRMLFDSTDEVDKNIRNFYKACSNNAGAFYFG